jgi:WhiB family redox-sensing transcriptional regulator
MAEFLFPRDAACRGMDTELFFPVPGDVAGVARAKAVCAGCPVRAECLAVALAGADVVPGAVWGGTTGEEREALLRRAA